MKIDRLDAHDRHNFFTRQSFDIGKTCQDLIDSRPFGDTPFYIFAHKREIGLDERISIAQQSYLESLINGDSSSFMTLSEVPTARIIWQPRLTKPKAQPNSMLFKAYPGTDLLRVIWIIPQIELWDQYSNDKLSANQTVAESIYDFKHNRSKLEAKEDDDLNDKQIDAIYKEIALSANRPKFDRI